MTFPGYALSDTHHPIRIETILKELPRNIVKEFLKEYKGGEARTVGEAFDHLETLVII